MDNSNLTPLIMIGGTDGSGKGLVVDTLAELCEKEHKKVFDFRKYEQENTFQLKGIKYTPTLPMYEDVKNNDVMIIAEPTKSEVGYAIREVLKIPEHDAKGIAEMFSSDRYNIDLRLVTPCRKNGISIIKERGVESSFVYQYEWAKYNNKELSMNDLLNLHGNKTAFREYSPSHLIIVHCPVEVSIDRLKNRDKKDDAVYENKKDFMQNVLDRYLSTEIKELFESVGTKVIYFDSNTSCVQETKDKVKTELWSEIKPYLR